MGPTKTNVSCCLVCLYYMLLFMALYCFCFPVHIDKYNNNNNVPLSYWANRYLFRRSFITLPAPYVYPPTR
ncbi:unnamed protein product [Musa acuminata subsp. malaccensis]|uniref:(wild Malaysian banana) hypothetical protein n=1 Tax=Musa acuminata subsp. malaccensis TaxID=214687 RepID=A0A804JNW1_MUSAM|nr:unnamed protein product [Musa acuminata subsp. malaccensis]